MLVAPGVVEDRLARCPKLVGQIGGGAKDVEVEETSPFAGVVEADEMVLAVVVLGYRRIRDVRLREDA